MDKIICGLDLDSIVWVSEEMCQQYLCSITKNKICQYKFAV